MSTAHSDLYQDLLPLLKILHLLQQLLLPTSLLVILPKEKVMLCIQITRQHVSLQPDFKISECHGDLE